MGNGAQRIPSWPGATAPTKAAYICADQPVTFTFRLQYGGGPYIPYCRHPWKSLSSEKHEFSGRAPESARCIDRESLAAPESRSAGGPSVPAGPAIHLLSRALESRHRCLSLCSLPVPKQFVMSLRSV